MSEAAAFGGEIAYIALGANMGDKQAALSGALDAIEDADGVKLTAVSSLYETAPVGGPGGQDQFLNAAAALETTLDPHELLDLLQSIETAHARTREIRWGPRTLDLDILFFGHRSIATERLIVPHPRLKERRFVLAPLAEIAPHFSAPELGKTCAALLAALDPVDIDDVVRLDAPWRTLSAVQDAMSLGDPDDLA